MNRQCMMNDINEEEMTQVKLDLTDDYHIACRVDDDAARRQIERESAYLIITPYMDCCRNKDLCFCG